MDGAIADYTKVIELKPSNPFNYYGRGLAKSAKRDLNGAIADYMRAIELKPDFAFAYDARGVAKRAERDWDGAIADYIKAIELKPNFVDAYSHRGATKKARGDFDGAMADFTKAIDLNPKSTFAYHSRGCLRYDSENFTGALADFRKVLELDPYSDYARFRVWLIRTRLGEGQAATTELKTSMATRETGKTNEWSSKIGHFLAGQATEAELLASAKSTNQNTEGEQLCQAYFYAGTIHLFAGEKAVAADCFRRSIATGEDMYLEYSSAVAELKMLKAQTN